MVKKTYIVPQLITAHIAAQSMIALSMDRGTNTITDQNNILVKGDNSSQSSYNVWDDDWSK